MTGSVQDKQPRKRGRPLKQPEERVSVTIRANVLQSEFDAIMAICLERNASMSAVVRDMILEGLK